MFEIGGCPQAVIVQECEQSMLGCLGTRVLGGGTTPCLFVMRQSQRDGIAACGQADQRIGGIIDDDYLSRQDGLGQHAGQGLLQQCRAVVAGDDDRNAYSGPGCGWQVIYHDAALMVSGFAIAA